MGKKITSIDTAPWSQSLHDDDLNECLLFLYSMLWDWSDFRRRLAGVKRKFPKGIGVEDWEGKWSDIVLYLDPTYPEDPTHEENRLKNEVAVYHRALEKLAQYCGLNLDRDLEYLHILQTEGLKRLLPSMNILVGIESLRLRLTGEFNFQSRPRKYRITWENMPLLSKDYHKQKVLEQFEEQWDQEEISREREGFVKKGKRRTALERHMVWVFKRVCLKKSWRDMVLEELRVNDDKHTKPIETNTLRTITKPTKAIIEKLGLTEPKLPPGCPQK